MTKATVGLALVSVLAAGPAVAHHGERSALGTVTIAQPVLAGGKTLQPGTYEVWDTGEHVKPLPGQSEDAQTYIEFVSNGTVVARDVAEVMPAPARAVGTSGGAATRLRLERLRGGDFMRVSTYRDGERYLIHLPVPGQP
ncbi:MAG: hypothetical protein HY657_15770 [Acidobacteria bacterium]|nr:hypothetical protein [Acidobacteriota bacterium]